MIYVRGEAHHRLELLQRPFVAVQALRVVEEGETPDFSLLVFQALAVVGICSGPLLASP